MSIFQFTYLSMSFTDRGWLPRQRHSCYLSKTCYSTLCNVKIPMKTILMIQIPYKLSHTPFSDSKNEYIGYQPEIYECILIGLATEVCETPPVGGIRFRRKMLE